MNTCTINLDLEIILISLIKQGLTRDKKKSGGQPQGDGEKCILANVPAYVTCLPAGRSTRGYNVPAVRSGAGDCRSIWAKAGDLHQNSKRSQSEPYKPCYRMYIFPRLPRERSFCFRDSIKFSFSPGGIETIHKQEACKCSNYQVPPICLVLLQRITARGRIV